jgi:hypothetical protein
LSWAEATGGIDSRAGLGAVMASNYAPACRPAMPKTGFSA